MRKRMIITGASGLLAMNWAYIKKDEYDICLLTHRHKIELAGTTTKAINLDDIDEISKVISDFKPSLVVHTAGLTNVDSCQKNPEEALASNRDIAANVAKASSGRCRLIHISTDHLFDGEKELVDENEATHPLNCYAETKLLAEQAVMEIHPEALVVRTNFYGWGHRDRKSFSDWIYESLASSKKITMFDDVYFTPTLIDGLVDACHEVDSMSESGVFNIVGDERVSKYAFAKVMAEVFNLDSSLILKGSINGCSMDAERPKDMSLSNKKVVDLIGHHIGTVEQGLMSLLTQKQNNRDVEINHAYIG